MARKISQRWNLKSCVSLLFFESNKISLIIRKYLLIVKIKLQFPSLENIENSSAMSAFLFHSPRPFLCSISMLANAKSLQSCPTLCNPMDGSPPGSAIPGILQARTLEWVAISFSNAWKWKVKVKSLSHVRLFATPWTAAYQAPRSMGFSRQEYWSGLK